MIQELSSIGFAISSLLQVFKKYRVIISRINLFSSNNAYPAYDPLGQPLGVQSGSQSFLLLPNFSSACDDEALRHHMYRNIGHSLSDLCRL